MYSLGQTLREKKKNNLILYLGWDEKGGREKTHFVTEDGKLHTSESHKFYSKYTHINDEFGMPIAGIHEQQGCFFGFWEEGKSKKPDLLLRGYLYVDSEECEILRENRIGKILLKIIDFIKSCDEFLNLSNGDTAYKSNFFWKSLENKYPHFEFTNRDYYLIDKTLLKRDQRHILEKVRRVDCEVILNFMNENIEKLEEYKKKNMIPMKEDEKIKTIVDILNEYESKLSDGYGWYTRPKSVDNVLTEIAKEILKEIKS